MSNGTSIAELFEADPLKLTREDMTPIVEYYREKRLQFKLGDKTAGATKKIPAKGEKQDLTNVELDI